MEFFDLVRKRRSIRKFRKERVPEDVLGRIVEVAMYAPSARNRRPVHLILIDDRNTILEIAKLREGAFGFLKTAPLAVVVASEPVDTWESDSAIVATLIQLCATDLGLGSCWGHIVDRCEDGAKKLLDIPKDKRVLCVIGIGYPAEDKPPHGREEVDLSRVHRGRW